MEFCQCCNKKLKDESFFDTCMCRPPFCPSCGYCMMHDQHIQPHTQVHQQRINDANKNQTADNQQSA